MSSNRLTRRATPEKDIKRRQPTKKARHRVRAAFDAPALARICVEQDFSDYADYYALPAYESKWGSRDRFYWHADNGSDILAVAHLDHVQADGRCSVMDTSAGLLACSGALDDRLGAYVILELLPQLGIVCDWLLTTDEECGASTAAEFTPEKDYNWMFSFDRGGTDVVMYEYETPELAALVEDSGARVGMGSFSDISVLDHLGCAGFNWGVGYQDYHGPRSHAWLEDTFRMVARFVKFFQTNATTVFPHEYVPYAERIKASTTADDWRREMDEFLNWNKPDDDPSWRITPKANGNTLLDKASEDAWWDKNYELVADCGHAVNLDDARTYVECEGGSLVVCTACGTP